ncbi:phosphoesterase [Thermococcus sp. Bubb.Bath]|nr:phosphoesterase [Thermococcus sp. Bubb.Bath]
MVSSEVRDSLKRIASAVEDREVLIRLDVFLLLYFGWMGFTVLYDLIKEHSRDVTSQLLRLPFTSRSFVVASLKVVHEVPGLYQFLHGVYYIGFTGSIALTVFFILLYWRDLGSADELAARYLLAYSTCGIMYSLFHVYAPHYVYHIQVFSPDETYLTQPEFVLPSLHNTIAAVNILTLWKHRKKIWGALLIGLSSLVPFATVLLAQHWVYDALAGILLAMAIGKATEGHQIRVHESIRRMHVSKLRMAMVLGFIAMAYILIFAITTPKS